MMHKGYICILSAAHAVADLPPGALPALLPFFALYYHLSYTEIAGLMFASSCLSSAVQPVFGLLADRSDKNALMATGVLLSGIGLALTGFVSGYWTVFAGVTLMGIGSAIFHPQAARSVNFLAGKQKSTGIGIFSVGGNAGFGFGPLIAVWAVTLWGLKGTALFGIFGIAFALVLLILNARLTQATAQSRSENAPDCKVRFREGTNDWHAFARLTLVIIGRSVVFCTVSAFLPLYCIRTLGVTEAVAGTTIAVLAFGCAAMTLLGGYLGDRIGLIRMLRLGSLVLVPSTAALVLCPNIFWIYVVLMVLSFGINAPYPAFVVLGQTYLAKNIGFASGVTLGLSFSVGGLFVPILGKLADATSLTVVFTVLIALSALCALGAFMLREIPRKEPLIKE